MASSKDEVIAGYCPSKWEWDQKTSGDKYPFQYDTRAGEEETAVSHVQVNPTLTSDTLTIHNAFLGLNPDQTLDLQKRAESTGVDFLSTFHGHELTEKQHNLQTLLIGIWQSTYYDKPLRVATALDTAADANFISVDRVNELGYVLATLPEYQGREFSTICGGEVYPVARIMLRWHYLMNPSIDYEDEFLVINTNSVGCVLGIRTIEQRVIYTKGPKFQKTGLKPLDKHTEKKLKDNAAQRRNEERAGRLEEMRRALLAGQSGQSSGMGSSQSMGWSGWVWHPEHQKYWRSKIDEHGETVYEWEQ